MKKISVLLCSLGLTCILAGCGREVELTEEENEIITEYAVSLLLKYDKNYNDHLVDLALLEEELDSETEEDIPSTEDAAPENNPQDTEPTATEVVDATEEIQASSIEEFYGIQGFSFQYIGYDMTAQYPAMAENPEDAFFAMEATPGTQLLVLKFQAINQSGVEAELDMLRYGTKLKISVNGEASKNALSTMLLDDLQTYRGTVGAYELAELVAVVEVPTGTSVENLSLMLKNDTDSVTLVLQ